MRNGQAMRLVGAVGQVIPNDFAVIFLESGTGATYSAFCIKPAGDRR
jgi:hypothetical protein